MMRRLVLTVRTKTGETFVSTSEINLDPEVDPVMNTIILLAQMREVGYLRVGKVADWTGEIVVPLDNVAFLAISEAP